MTSSIISSDSSSPLPSTFFAISAFLFISLLVVLLLRYYLPFRSSPAYLVFPIFLSLALPASIIAIVPIDLAASSGSKDIPSRGIWLPERALLIIWRITYWLCFVLTWAILPILGEYIDSGDRSPRGRLLYSLRSNGRYQLIVLGCCAVGLIYFIFQSGVRPTNIKALVVDLAYCWGLVLAIYLMGHGLVAVPRKFLRNTSTSGRLRKIQASAPGIHDKLEAAAQELDGLEAQVQQLSRQKSGISRDLQDWVEELVDNSRRSSWPSLLSTSNSSATARPLPTVITERYLADLTRHLARARHRRARFVDAWERLIEDARKQQAILDASASHRLDFGKPSKHGHFLSRMTVLTPYSRYFLYIHIFPLLNYFHFIVSALASTCIIWSELIKPIAPQLSIISLTVTHHRHSTKDLQITPAGQTIAALWLLYIFLTALSPLPTLLIWGNRALVRRNTYPESACWYAGQVARLTIPLAYNFITFLPEDVYRRTTFYEFLGRLINLTPVGKAFDRFFPLTILLPVFATLFGVYGKIRRRLFGFAMSESEDEEEGDEEGNLSGYGLGGWREGQMLIERDLGTSHVLPHSSSSPTHPPHRLISNNPSNRPQPTISLPPSTSSSNPHHPLPTTTSPSTTRRTLGLRADDPSEEDEGNFFSDFAHRVRNTFDTSLAPVRKPRWMEDLGERRGGAGGGLGRLFGWGGGGGGSRRGEGRVRL
ncbi:MAG: hypothetical protein M1817_004880 [Caeruleum heppii]|nr:MAG: hypothetical protein M1817_004880 [Caeruleum heppii]